MRATTRAGVLLCCTLLGCAGGQSDNVLELGPPRLPQDDGDSDREENASESGALTEGEGEEPFDDAGVTTGGAPADEGAEPPPEPVPMDDGGSSGDGAEPPPMDDGAEPPPPPPPMGLEPQCLEFCDGLQACGLIENTQAGLDYCIDECALPISQACDDAWADVMTCVIPLSCAGMTAWAYGDPGYPCEAQDQAASDVCPF